jgi:hypothetical protein
MLWTDTQQDWYWYAESEDSPNTKIMNTYLLSLQRCGHNIAFFPWISIGLCSTLWKYFSLRVEQTSWFSSNQVWSKPIKKSYVVSARLYMKRQNVAMSLTSEFKNWKATCILSCWCNRHQRSWPFLECRPRSKLYFKIFENMMIIIQIPPFSRKWLILLL